MSSPHKLPAQTSKWRERCATWRPYCSTAQSVAGPVGRRKRGLQGLVGASCLRWLHCWPYCPSFVGVCASWGRLSLVVVAVVAACQAGACCCQSRRSSVGGFEVWYGACSDAHLCRFLLGWT